MTEDVRIRLTEQSLETGESAIPTTADEFTAWLSRALPEREGVETVEVVVQFSEERAVEDVTAFLEAVAASNERTVGVSELTIELRFGEG